MNELMQLQKLDTNVLFEHHHDQYARTGKLSAHRLDRFSRADNEIKDDAKRKAVLLDILIHVHTLLQSWNISYTLWAGSLLGAYRHRDFIPWDDDVDIALLSSDSAIILRSLLREEAKRNTLLANKTENAQSKYQWVVRAGKDSDIILVKVVDKTNGYFVDIFHLFGGGGKGLMNSTDFVSTFFTPPKCFPFNAMMPTIPCCFGKYVFECVRHAKVILDINYPSGLGVPKKYQEKWNRTKK